MKKPSLLLSIGVLAAACFHANAQVYSANIVGYANLPFAAGNTYFTDFFLQTPDNLLNDVFTVGTASGLADGTTISSWNPATLSFSVAATYADGAWDHNLNLAPGTAFELTTATPLINFFIGSVSDRGGAANYIGTDGLDFPPPPVYTGPDGTFLLADKVPIMDVGVDIFVNILGRDPNIGEQVTLLNDGVSTTSTYLGDGAWDTATPVLNPGQGALITIQSGLPGVSFVPEPAISALLPCGLGAWIFLVRRRQSR